MRKQRGATWYGQGAAPAAESDGGYHISVDFNAPGVVDVTINGVASDYPTTLSSTSGLSINASRVAFSDISWQ